MEFVSFPVSLRFVSDTFVLKISWKPRGSEGSLERLCVISRVANRSIDHYVFIAFRFVMLGDSGWLLAGYCFAFVLIAMWPIDQ